MIPSIPGIFDIAHGIALASSKKHSAPTGSIEHPATPCYC